MQLSRFAALALLTAASSSLANARPVEVHFYDFPIQRSAVVPPLQGSSTDGNATMILDDVTGEVWLQGFIGSLQVSNGFKLAIHGPATETTNGPVLVEVDLPAPVGGSTFKENFLLTSAQVDIVRTGQAYVELSSLPAAIDATRGNVRDLRSMTGAARSENVVPATTSSGFSVQKIFIDLSASTLRVLGGYDGLDGDVVSVELRGPAAAGSNGPLITSISNTGGTDGQFNLNTPLTPSQRDWARDALLYITINTTVWPDGELRNQLAAGGSSPHPIGTNYLCFPAAHSAGPGAGIQAVGSPLLADNQFLLRGFALPPNQFTYFVAGQSVTDVPFAGGSQGRLCIAGPTTIRLLSSLQSSGATGFIEAQIDLPTFPVALAAGDIWNFQGWFRDQNPAPTSNFTTAVSVLFQ